MWLQNEIVLNNPAIKAHRRTYITLVAMQTMLYKISPKSSWAERLKQLIESNTFILTSKANMGMPEAWYDDPFWSQALP